MTFIAVLDANVLWPARLRCTLIRAALEGLYQPVRTERIIQEAADAIKRERPDLDAARIDRTTSLMRAALPQAMVCGYEELEPAMRNHEKDRHVLAAAVRARAGTIVTSNTRHFPASSRAPYSIDLHTPDEYLLDLWELSNARMMAALHKQAAGLKRPPMTVREVVESLGESVPRFARVVLDSGLIGGEQ